MFLRMARAQMHILEKSSPASGVFTDGARSNAHSGEIEPGKGVFSRMASRGWIVPLQWAHVSSLFRSNGFIVPLQLIGWLEAWLNLLRIEAWLDLVGVKA